jgi:hypothetical protein
MDHLRAFPRSPSKESRSPYGKSVRTPAPISTVLRLARHLEVGYLVPLYVRHRRAAGLRRFAARSVSYLLAGLHGLLALPEGDADYLSTLAVIEDDEPFEAGAPWTGTVHSAGSLSAGRARLVASQHSPKSFCLETPSRKAPAG